MQAVLTFKNLKNAIKAIKKYAIHAVFQRVNIKWFPIDKFCRFYHQ